MTTRQAQLDRARQFVTTHTPDEVAEYILDLLLSRERCRAAVADYERMTWIWRFMESEDGLGLAHDAAVKEGR